MSDWAGMKPDDRTNRLAARKSDKAPKGKARWGGERERARTPLVVSVGSGCSGWLSSGRAGGLGGAKTTYWPLRGRTSKLRVTKPGAAATAKSCTASAKLPEQTQGREPKKQQRVELLQPKLMYSRMQ